jgi:RNA polymerase sigma-70 factor (ECF subfamily)
VLPEAPDDARADEERLVRRAQLRDADAYGELVTHHQAAAFRVAYVMLGSAADAEDAVQEAFLRAYLALDRFRVAEPFRPWLLRIVGNEARNRRRSAGRRAGVLGRAITAMRGGTTGTAVTREAAAEVESGPVSPSPEVAVLGGETRAELRDALGRLRDEERLVVTCRYLLDLSEVETSAALGIPPGTVKSRLHRGLGRLRAELDHPGRAAEGWR